MNPTARHESISTAAELDVPPVSIILTVKNDPIGVRITLESLREQSHRPDEIVVVDGGSTDDTRDVVRSFLPTLPQLRLLIAGGANIARGRNVATEAATHEIIASIDAGCRAEPTWLEAILRPFSRRSDIEFVAGVYRIAPRSLFESVVGLTTMRGQLEPFDPIAFNPSARSLAYTRSLWARVGGWPEWLAFSEDTWFDHRVRDLGATWSFAGDAVVHWRPRSSWKSLAKQFYNYGTGRGYTGIDAPSFRYNLRNFALLAATAAACFASTWFFVPLLMLVAYVFGWTFHARALRVARHCNRPIAYALCVAVMSVVMLSNTLGYVVGATRRRRRPLDPSAPPATACNEPTGVLRQCDVHVDLVTPHGEQTRSPLERDHTWQAQS